MPERYDLALSKTIRGYDNDLQVIQEMHEKKPFSLNRLVALFESEVDGMVTKDKRALRLNVHLRGGWLCRIGFSEDIHSVFSWDGRSGSMRLIARQFAVSALVAGMSSGAAAQTCPRPTSQYDYSVNVGFAVGLTFVPQVRFTYGVDLRLGRGPFSGFARVEGRGQQYAQYLVGVDYVHHPAHGEVAVAFNGRHADHDVGDVVGSALGLHLAFGDWNSAVAGQVEGMIPVVGDRRNGDAGLSVFWIVPGGWLSILSCGTD